MKKIIEALLLLGASVFLTSCGFVKSSGNETVDQVITAVEISIPHDSIVEEAIENKIKDWTGVEIDLTPSSPEE